MILCGQVKRQGGEGGAENKATTFPSAKLTVMCTQVHRMGEGQLLKYPQNKLLQSLVRHILSLLS